MHLHRVWFCHLKFRFGRCPQSLTVTGLCRNQPPIRNELFDPLSNITFRNVWTGSFPVRQTANRELLSNALGNRACVEQILSVRLAGFQNCVVDLLRLRFQPLTVFFVCQVRTFPIQPCLQSAKRICPIQKLLQRRNMIFLHDTAERGRMQIQRIFSVPHRITMAAVQRLFFDLPARVSEQLPRFCAECTLRCIVRPAL